MREKGCKGTQFGGTWQGEELVLQEKEVLLGTNRKTHSWRSWFVYCNFQDILGLWSQESMIYPQSNGWEQGKWWPLVVRQLVIDQTLDTNVIFVFYSGCCYYLFPQITKNGKIVKLLCVTTTVVASLFVPVLIANKPYCLNRRVQAMNVHQQLYTPI